MSESPYPGGFHMRGWNIEITDTQSQNVLEAWLHLLDNQDSYTNERIDLLDAIDELKPAVRDEDSGNIEKFQEDLKEVLEDASISLFEPVRSAITPVLVDFANVETSRDEIQDLLWENTEIDLDGLRQDAADADIEVNAGQFKGRIGDIVAEEADEIASSSYDFEALLEGLETAQEYLESQSFIQRYRDAHSRVLEDYLEGKSPATDFLLRETIERLFAELYVDEWREDGLEKAIKSFAKEESLAARTSDLKEILRGEEPETVCYVPIENVQLGGMTPLEVGEVDLYEPSSDDCDIFDRLHESTAIFEDQLRGNSDIIAELKVRLPISSVGRRRVEAEINRVIDVLNFGKTRNLIEMPFDGRYTILCETGDGEVIDFHRSLSSRFDADFMHTDSPETVTKRIDLFDRYLQGTPETELEKAIDKSVRWYGYAAQSTHPEERFLKYVIALESLLVKDITESKANTIAHRAVQILQVHEDYRGWEYTIFDEMYAIRSRIVHQGVRNLPEFEYQLDRLRQRTRQVISAVTYRVDDCNSIDEVVETIQAEEEQLKQEKTDRSPIAVGESFETEATLQTPDGRTIGTVELEAEFYDDGRYVYYEGEIHSLEHGDQAKIQGTDDYELSFELDGTEYVGLDVSFPENSAFELVVDPTYPFKIRWYDIQESD